MQDTGQLRGWDLGAAFYAHLPHVPFSQTDIIKNQAEQLSKQGFRCLIPDLYKGKIGVDAEEAAHVSGQRVRWSQKPTQMGTRSGVYAKRTYRPHRASPPPHTHTPPHATQLMNALDFQNAVEELKQAVEYLRTTGSPKV